MNNFFAVEAFFSSPLFGSCLYIRTLLKVQQPKGFCVCVRSLIQNKCYTFALVSISSSYADEDDDGRAGGHTRRVLKQTSSLCGHQIFLTTPIFRWLLFGCVCSYLFLPSLLASPIPVYVCVLNSDGMEEAIWEGERESQMTRTTQKTENKKKGEVFFMLLFFQMF